MQFAVRVTPKGGRDRIDGWAMDSEGRAFLRVKVSAAPADGAANAAVVALLAKALGRPKAAVAIISGESARLKRLNIEGVDSEDLARAFGPRP